MRDKRTLYYRYISLNELKSILKDFKIESKSGITYFTYERYDDPNVAYNYLALAKKPDFRSYT
ncbi:hypothetical protein HRbin06_00145 [archaeon HR06]|nr:hypothetical protein HRbin06_00145 [archaeon HR06]